MYEKTRRELLGGVNLDLGLSRGDFDGRVGHWPSGQAPGPVALAPFPKRCSPPSFAPFFFFVLLMAPLRIPGS